MSLETLIEASQRNDVDGFLIEYLELTQKYPSLTIPVSEKISTVKMEWRNCLPSKLEVIPDSFMRSLSIRWLEIISKLGREFYDGYTKDALRVVKNQKSFNQKLKEIVRVGNHTVTVGGDPKLNQVVPTVSDAYYQSLKKSEPQQDDSSLH